MTTLHIKYKTLLDKYEINTPLRLAHFFSQIHHESGGFKSLSESFDYTPQRLISLFGTNRISIKDANLYGRTSNQKANQKAIANIIYGGEWGRKNLGNTLQDDGWNFRGRGFKQVTGRFNYQLLSRETGINYMLNPDKLTNEADAMLSACWFWKRNKINRFADKDDYRNVTKIVNGGFNGLSERENLLVKYKNFFK